MDEYRLLEIGEIISQSDEVEVFGRWEKLHPDEMLIGESVPNKFISFRRRKYEVNIIKLKDNAKWRLNVLQEP